MSSKLNTLKKTCPFLKENFKLDTQDNTIAVEFLKSFCAMCPAISNNKNINGPENQSKQEKNCPIAMTNLEQTQKVCPNAKRIMKMMDQQSNSFTNNFEIRNPQINLKSKVETIHNNVSQSFSTESQLNQNAPIITKSKIEIFSQYIKNLYPASATNIEENIKSVIQQNNKPNYTKKFEDSITTIKREGRYREFKSLNRPSEQLPLAQYYTQEQQEIDEVTSPGENITLWCSNDYMGQSGNPVVKDAMIDVIKEVGVGAGGTRNIGGTSIYHVRLEKEVANLHRKDAGLIFASCFVANQAAMNGIKSVFKDMIYISDEKNHASIIEGIKNSRADKLVYKHNNMEDLERKLKSIPLDRHKCVVFESVYSMSGTISPIQETIALAKKYNAMTFIDEVHAVGLYGHEGAGVAQQLGCEDELDFISGTFGKAFGCAGGYIVGNKWGIDCIRSFAPNFIFTTSIPPSLAAACQASVKYLKEHNELREKLQSNARKIKNQLKNVGVKVLQNESHIVPIFIGDATIAKQASDMLLDEHRTYIQPINYPTVNKGEELLRISPSPLHEDKHINELVQAVVATFDKLGIERFKE